MCQEILGLGKCDKGFQSVVNVSTETEAQNERKKRVCFSR
jgi:hypothetical protein